MNLSMFIAIEVIHIQVARVYVRLTELMSHELIKVLLVGLRKSILQAAYSGYYTRRDILIKLFKSYENLHFKFCEDEFSVCRSSN